MVEALVFAGRRLRHLRRNPARVLGVALNPVLFLVVFGHLLTAAMVVPGAGSYAEYLFAGAAVQVGLACVGSAAGAVATDLRGGLVDRFRSLPVARPAVLLGQVLADTAAACGALAVVAAVGLLVGWRARTGPVEVLAGFGVALLFAFAMAWVGVLIGLAVGDPESVGVLTPVLVVVLPLLSNAFLAPQGLPAWLRPVAEWNPLTAVVSACRVLWGNAPPTAGTPVVTAVGALAVVVACAAALCLRRYQAPATR
ncbi:hypothetical protein BJP25_24220 [Actinokineospora bangkokensis]|uniref:Transport permease protein n=1 Tax=Actinokineospora bangkokensis TaxID=1193682 RepID=A0A1Q9LJ21_9PSEU|nr:hypothetical protein BJP25_24220 [Actinokineospora bangkokensis]